MRKMEIPAFEEFTKNFYPGFTLKNDVIIDAWLLALGQFSLNQCEKAVTIFYSQSKTQHEPKPGHLKEIIEANRQSVTTTEADYKPDFPLAKFQNDIALGCCRHNLYVYRDAEKLVNCGLTDDFDEALRLACQQRMGRDYEFPSKNNLAAHGLAEVKASPEQVKMIFNAPVWRGESSNA